MPEISSTGGSTAFSNQIANNAGAAAPAKSKNDMDKDMFLKLLVTQLKYQDPMNPADPNDFLAQTAQFTSVEKLTALAEESTKSALGQRMTTASSMIGKDVSFAGDNGISQSGTVQSARITDEGDIMLNIGGGREVGLLEVTTISQAGFKPAATSSPAPAPAAAPAPAPAPASGTGEPAPAGTAPAASSGGTTAG